MMRITIIALCGLGLAFGATIVSQSGGEAALRKPKSHKTVVRPNKHHSVEMYSKSTSTIDPYRMPVNGSTPTGWIQVGTPKKWIYVIFDTGSDKLVAKTWDTVANELSAVDQGIDGLVEPSAVLYNHDGSSSYHRRFTRDPVSLKMMPERGTITYGSGTAITDIGEDKVFVGDRSLENFTLMEISKDNLQMLHTSKGIAGILGLQHMKNRSLGHSFFSRMRDAGQMTSFGYCYGSGNNSTFIWGDDSTEGTASEVIGEMHWAVRLGDVHVVQPEEAGSGSLVEALAHSFPKQAHKIKHLKPNMLTEILHEIGEDIDRAIQEPGPSGVDIVKKIMGAQGKDKLTDAEKKKIADIVDKVFGHQSDSQEAREKEGHCDGGSCTGILDTGSNIIAGPREAIAEMTRMLNIEPDCSNFDALPSISMNFGGQVVTVEPHGYVMKVPVPEQGQDDREAGSGQDPSSQDETGSGQDSSSQDGFQTIEEHGEESEAGLAETQSSRVKAAFGSRWKAAFERLNKVHGIDLTGQLSDILDKLIDKGSEPKEMCMSAMVPIDKQTTHGPLWIVGTPLLDSYYARWSHEEGAETPQIHLKALKDADVCKEPSEARTKKHGLMRSEEVAEREDEYASHRNHQFGPQRITVRKLEEIAFPHWAKTLLTV